ncbi:unnamed protein product [Orchesella dallaii]|uniref:Uncharacterized protein n=1 Tax=Orchesella dallaii TaxID=48710 RepID=A0ABP1QBJ8_9HEXA
MNVHAKTQEPLVLAFCTYNAKLDLTRSGLSELNETWQGPSNGDPEHTCENHILIRPPVDLESPLEV